MAYQGTERRTVDSQRDRLSPEEYAARLHAINPDRAAQFADPDVNFGGGTHRGVSYTGETLRAALKNLLFRLDPSVAPEVANLLLSLEKGRREFIETLTFGKFLQADGQPRDGDIAPPSLEQIRASFSLDELLEALTFEEPTLLLLPEGVTFNDIVSAIDANKTLAGQEDTHVDQEVFGTATERTEKEPLKITGYHAVIVEGAGEMSVKGGDDISNTWANRVGVRKAARKEKPHLKGMDRIKAGFLMLHSYRKKTPIDRGTGTFLDDDPALSDSSFPYAYLRGWVDWCRPRFVARGPWCRYDLGRFRSSVGGDIFLT